MSNNVHFFETVIKTKISAGAARNITVGKLNTEYSVKTVKKR